MSPSRLQSHHGRALHWALSSPSLFDHPRAVTGADMRPDLDRHHGLLRQLDKRGSSLDRALRDPDANGLGPRFERLLQHWIGALPPTTVHATNWQVYAGDHTLGEFDLLFHRDRRLYHWELALKFYLGHPAEDGQFRWYDPLGKDRLDHKWAHLRGHQLRLHQHPAAQRALSALEIPQQPLSQAFIKGYLFEPLDPTFDVDYPPDINPHSPRGWWAYYGDISRFRRTLGADRRRWMALPIERWMSPARRGDATLQSFDAALNAWRHRPLLIAGFDDEAMRECTRGFVMPRDWPHHGDA